MVMSLENALWFRWQQTYKNIWRGEGYGYTAAVSLHRLDMRLPEIAVLLLVQQPCSSCSQHISHGTHFFHILANLKPQTLNLTLISLFYIYFDQDNLNSLAVFCTKPLLNNSFKKAGTPTHTLLIYDVQNNSSQLSSLRTSSTLIHNAKISHKDFCSLSGGWNSFWHSRVKTRLRLLALQSACHAAEKASPSSTACG